MHYMCVMHIYKPNPSIAIFKITIHYITGNCQTCNLIEIWANNWRSLEAMSIVNWITTRHSRSLQHSHKQTRVENIPKLQAGMFMNIFTQLNSSHCRIKTDIYAYIHWICICICMLELMCTACVSTQINKSSTIEWLNECFQVSPTHKSTMRVR